MHYNNILTFTSIAFLRAWSFCGFQFLSLLLNGRNKNAVCSISTISHSEVAQSCPSTHWIYSSRKKMNPCNFNYEKAVPAYSLVQWIVYTFDAVWSKFDSIPHQECIQFTGPNCTDVLNITNWHFQQYFQWEIRFWNQISICFIDSINSNIRL